MKTRQSLYLFLFVLVTFLFSACSSTKNLQKNEYMLNKNVVKMTDVKGAEFDNLVYFLRPETNKKFMGFINFKTSVYASHPPKVKKDGTIKDTKFNRWMRESVGEPPVLLDSSQIDHSIEQVQMAMKKMGYFNTIIEPEIVFGKSNPKKAKVVYHVTANQPYFINKINYYIDIPEYRKYIILDTANSLIKVGSRYDEETLSNERSRIANLIREKGYYHASTRITTIEVDTINATKNLDRKGNRTVEINILINFDEFSTPASIENQLYRYQYDKVYIYTNHDIHSNNLNQNDTVLYRSYRDKQDSTLSYFISPHKENILNSKNRVIKDFKYKTLTDVIYTKKGWLYSPSYYNRSYRRLADLNNFNIINIEYIENVSSRDTNLKIGLLDARYRLTRSKLHSFSAELDIRTDKSNIAFTYTNRNIFKGAEHLNINAYGSIYYYNWLKKGEETKVYEDIGVNVSLDFPRLFLFRQTQKIEALRYSTSLLLGVNYSWLYYRLMLNTSLSYRWSPNYNINHTFTPISLSTIDTSRNTVRSISNYPSDYRQKFNKNFILSLKYSFDYLIPIKNKSHNLRFTIDLESSGLLITGLNAMSNAINNKDNVWTIAGYNYATYEKGEVNLRHNYTINKNNAIASRFNIGLAYPLFNSNTLPFERSFYLGGANSMRAWSFRSLGPGGFTTNENIERTGDIKLELNFEYRGTIYKAVKFGIFADMGNIWMTRSYEGMPNAEFKLNRFYKEIAIALGVGLRLDFNFFLIRLDYGVPIHDPSKPTDNKWIHGEWTKQDANGNRLWQWGQGFQFAIGHAF